MKRLVMAQLTTFFLFLLTATSASAAHVKAALNPGSVGVVCEMSHDLIALANTEGDCATSQSAVVDTKGTLRAASTLSGAWTTATGIDLETGSVVELSGPVYGFNRGQKVMVIEETDDHQGHTSVLILVTN